VAADVILAMLEQVQESGFLPHMVPPEGEPSSITQPPILGWAVATLFRRTACREWAAACLPYLLRFLEWVERHRDRNANALPEWQIEGSPLCRSGESGMDNSPRFDSAVLMDAVDFASYLCHDWNCAAELAACLGQTATSEACRRRADRVAAAVNALLWNEGAGFYFDRRLDDGGVTGVKAASGFTPLHAGIPTPAQAAALRRHLLDPESFGAPLPIPSVSLDAGVYCKDMWRGPTWINLNYLAALGLRRYGFVQEANGLREATLAAVQKWYEREGCLFEYYDSLDITSPRLLDRKQRLITGRGIAPISDYHWTAALVAAWLLEEKAASGSAAPQTPESSRRSDLDAPLAAG
ncbi:MAG: trehalase family glycosidase, partial [Armatimonadota bacterium]|nr:trehalase family glycosidase [Armatimonadota bacterium]